MVDFIIETILEPVFLTLGVLFIKLLTLWKYPSPKAKERYSIIFEGIGLVLSIGILVFIAFLFF